MQQGEHDTTSNNKIYELSTYSDNHYSKNLQV